MRKEVKEKEVETLNTTIGDLIAAVSDIAIEAGKTEEEGYRLASLTLERILLRNTRDLSGISFEQ